MERLTPWVPCCGRLRASAVRRDRARGSGDETEGEVVSFGPSESGVVMSRVRMASCLPYSSCRALWSPNYLYANRISLLCVDLLT